MRINRFVAASTGISRREADKLIELGRVLINGKTSQTGQSVTENDSVTLDGQILKPLSTQTIILHKPVGYVTSREGQGSKTIYDLLPAKLRQLKPVGRLDKDSSGLLLMTNNGQLAQELTHPKYQKVKVYEISLDKPLEPLHQQIINERGVLLDDGPSKLQLEKNNDSRNWVVTMREGRNRQIRRTFAALGYIVAHLHRTQFGTYQLPGSLLPGHFTTITT